MTQHTLVIYENGHLIPTVPLEGIPEHAIIPISFDAEPRCYSMEEQLAALHAAPVDEELADAIEAGRKTPWNVEEF